jgi:hypothetical protein
MAKARLNHAEIGAWLRSGEMAAVLMGEAEPALARAVASAPVRTGEYRASLRAWTEVHSDRVVAHVGSDSGHALAVEAATGNLARCL